MRDMKLQQPEGHDYITIFRGLIIYSNEEVISRFPTLPMSIRWRKEERIKAIIKNKNLFLEYAPIEDKNEEGGV